MQEVGHVKLTVTGDIRRLRLEHGDRVVITFRERLPITAIRDVKKQLETYFPRNEVMIIAGIEAIAILRAGDDLATPL